MSGRVFVVESVLETLRDIADGSRPLETGGVLTGVLRDGEPWITAAVEIRDPSGTSSRYMIPRGATPRAIHLARERESRVGYLGDWHSHPANVPASATDRAALRRNAKRPKKKELATIMLVVRDAGERWEIDAMEDDGQVARPIEIIVTGELAVEES